MTFEATTDCATPLPPGGSCTVSAQFIGARREVSHASVIVTDGGNTAQTELSVVALPRLTIRTAGAGQVRITSEPPIPCDDGCSFLHDATITMIATPTGASTSYFTGWSSSNVENPSCGGLLRECLSYPFVSETVTANFGELANNLIFVSSETFPTNLGGTAPYDAACNRLASAAGINDASGTGYIAVMSGPRSFVERVPASARGWVRMDGLPVADALAGLLDNGPAPFYPVSLTEIGRPSLESTWTGTQADGSANHTCGDWTGGSPDDYGLQGSATTLAWLDLSGQVCDPPHAVYCMGVTKTAPVALQPFTGKRLWVTSTLLTVGSESPDAFCQASRPAGVANAAALIGEALRAGGDVLDPTATYVRLDGALLGTGSELRAGQLTTAIRFDSGGSALTTIDQVWTGGVLSARAASAENCNDWTRPEATGTFGIPTETNFRAFAHGVSEPCSEPRRLYCFEL
jgi:hypothetical protein